MTANDWHQSGRVMATRLLAAGLGAYQLADLAYRFGIMMRQHGARLAALGPAPGSEAGVAGTWARHVDGREVFLTPARIEAERAFCAGWDEVVDHAIRERTRNQRLPGEGGGSEAGELAFLTALGLSRECTEEDIKRAYRALARGAHPDAGGDHDLFITLGRARDEALAWLAARRAAAKRRGGGE